MSSHPISRLSPRAGLLVLISASLAWSCTNAQLFDIGELSSDTVTIQGEFCTTAPMEANQPVRVLFAVDYSNSMIHSDPYQEIVKAMEAVTKELKDVEYFSFGILRWGDTTVRELTDCAPATAIGPKTLFTRDQPALKAVFDRLRLTAAQYSQACTVGNLGRPKYLGGSDYPIALNAIREYIEDDVTANGANAAFFQYHVVFLTDGMPQSRGVSPSAMVRSILTALRQLSILIKAYAIRLDVVSVVKMIITAPEFKDILEKMAIAANGIYLPLNSPGMFGEEFKKILSAYRTLKTFELAPFASTSAPRALLVSNRNVRVGRTNCWAPGSKPTAPPEPDVCVDSDGDGLEDALEQSDAVRSNPASSDTDGDGLSDALEYRFRDRYNLTVPNAGISLNAEDLADEDGDGLNAFTETLLGTDPKLADTDGDVLPDNLEFQFGTNPRVSDLDADPDNDNLSNISEIRQHLDPAAEPRLQESSSADGGAGASDGGEAKDPRIAIDNFIRQRRSYQPDVVELPHSERDGRRCYQFRVANVTILQTSAAEITKADGSKINLPAGLNTIDLWRVERPMLSDPTKVTRGMLRLVHGEVRVLLRKQPEDKRDPPALELLVNDDNFEKK